MPSSRKRHTVTETEEVAAALAGLRAADPDGEVSLAELVILGADRKVELLAAERDDAVRRAEPRKRFLERTRTGAGIDCDALSEVRVRVDALIR